MRLHVLYNTINTIHADFLSPAPPRWTQEPYYLYSRSKLRLHSVEPFCVRKIRKAVYRQSEYQSSSKDNLALCVLKLSNNLVCSNEITKGSNSYYTHKNFKTLYFTWWSSVIEKNTWSSFYAWYINTTLSNTQCIGKECCTEVFLKMICHEYGNFIKMMDVFFSSHLTGQRVLFDS